MFLTAKLFIFDAPHEGHLVLTDTNDNIAGETLRLVAPIRHNFQQSRCTYFDFEVSSGAVGFVGNSLFISTNPIKE